MMVKANTAYITALYGKFDGAYRHSGFSHKNPQKYLRFVACVYITHFLT